MEVGGGLRPRKSLGALVTGGAGFLGSHLCERLLAAGNDVLCVDVDASKVEKLKRGIIPIHEPVLEAMIARNAAAGRLNFTTEAAAGVAHGLFQFKRLRTAA